MSEPEDHYALWQATKRELEALREQLPEAIVSVLTEHTEDYSMHCCDWHGGCWCNADDALLPEAERRPSYEGSSETWARHVAGLIDGRLRVSDG